MSTCSWPKMSLAKMSDALFLKWGGCKNHPKFVMFNNETNGFGAQHEKHCFFPSQILKNHVNSACLVHGHIFTHIYDHSIP